MINKKQETRNPSRNLRASKKQEIDVKRVAKLANLTLTQAEEQQFKKQLESVLKYVGQLNKLDTQKVEPIGQITGLKNVTRTEEASPSLSQEESLKNASRTQNGFFEVDAIFKENGPE